jgi:hypothetical protein
MNGVLFAAFTILGVIIAIIFHEIGHYLIGKYYRLDPHFTTTRIYGVPHPAVDYKKGSLPNKWSYLGGFIFSVAGIKPYKWILENLIQGHSIIMIFLAFYIVACLSLLGPFKGSDWNNFRKF